MPDSMGAPKKIRGLALEKEVIRLRTAGLSYESIARNLQCSVGGAHKACMRAIDRSQREIGEKADKVLDLELRRLDEMLRILWLKVLEGNLSAMDRALHVMDRRARFLGLDAPEKHEHTGREGGPIEHHYDFSHLSDEEIERQLETAAVAEAESIARGAAAEGEAG